MPNMIITSSKENSLSLSVNVFLFINNIAPKKTNSNSANHINIFAGSIISVVMPSPLTIRGFIKKASVNENNPQKIFLFSFSIYMNNLEMNEKWKRYHVKNCLHS